MFSNSAKYAMKAVLYLALHTDETKRVMVKDMYGKINVPQSYSSQVITRTISARFGLFNKRT